MMIETQAYCRIQGRDTAYRTGKPVGLFAAGWRLIRAGVLTGEDEALFREVERWFRENLPEPPFYDDDEPGKPITFFKTASSGRMFEKVLPILTLFDKHAYPYDIVFTNFVGKIVYEDAYQVGVLDE